MLKSGSRQQVGTKSKKNVFWPEMARAMSFALAAGILIIVSCATEEGSNQTTREAAVPLISAPQHDAPQPGAADAAPHAGFRNLGYSNLALEITSKPFEVFMRTHIVGPNFAAHYWAYKKVASLFHGELSMPSAGLNFAPQYWSNLDRTVQEPEPIEVAEDEELSPAALFMSWITQTGLVALFGFLFYRQRHVTGEKQ